MSTTPSPSKRARIPTSNIASATASPFAAGSSSARFQGPRSVGPSGTSAGGTVPAGLGMSPSDAFTPADAYGMSGLTPYSTTSPAYVAGAAGMSAASPISTALAHGSRVLSGIQAASPFAAPYPGSYSGSYSGQTPMIPQMQYPRYPQQAPFQSFPAGFQPATQQKQASQPRAGAPQQGSPEFLRASLTQLDKTLLPKLEAEAEAFFDAVDASLAVTTDARTTAQKAAAFQSALDAVLAHLDKTGLATIPLLPLHTTTEPTTASADTQQAANQDPPPQPQPSSQQDAKSSTEPPHLDAQLTTLQLHAKDLFARRQRLSESASIITAILDS